MFLVLGENGHEYGPIDADQLRRWVQEGRAGAATRVRREGTNEWTALQAIPEFDDVFRALPPLINAESRGVRPMAVTLVAIGNFIAAAVSGALFVSSAIVILRISGGSTSILSSALLVSWGITLIGLPIRVISGLGLLRLREWARKLAVIYAAVMAAYGAFGTVRSIGWLIHGDAHVALSSAMWLFSVLFGVGLLAFNIATVVILCHERIRMAFRS